MGVWFYLRGLSCRAFVHRGTGSASSSAASRSGVRRTVLLSPRVRGRSASPRQRQRAELEVNALPFYSDSDEELDDKHDPEKGLIQWVT